MYLSGTVLLTPHTLSHSTVAVALPPSVLPYLSQQHIRHCTIEDSLRRLVDCNRSDTEHGSYIHSFKQASKQACGATVLCNFVQAIRDSTLARSRPRSVLQLGGDLVIEQRDALRPLAQRLVSLLMSGRRSPYHHQLLHLVDLGVDHFVEYQRYHQRLDFGDRNVVQRLDSTPCQPTICSSGGALCLNSHAPAQEKPDAHESRDAEFAPAPHRECDVTVVRDAYARTSRSISQRERERESARTNNHTTPTYRRMNGSAIKCSRLQARMRSNSAMLLAWYASTSCVMACISGTSL